MLNCGLFLTVGSNVISSMCSRPMAIHSAIIKTSINTNMKTVVKSFQSGRFLYENERQTNKLERKINIRTCNMKYRMAVVEIDIFI